MKIAKYGSLIILFFVVQGFSTHNTTPFGTAILTEMDIVYEGIDNPLTIRTPGYSPNEITIIAEGATIVSETQGRYNLRAPRGIRKCSIKIYAKVDSVLRLIGGEYFRVRPLPTPIPQLGGIPNNGFPQSKAAVVIQSVLLSTYGPGFSYNLNNRITAYKAKVITTDSVYAFENDAPHIKADMQEKIKATQSGDIILFYEIESETQLKNDTVKVKCPSIVIPIK